MVTYKEILHGLCQDKYSHSFLECLTQISSNEIELLIQSASQIYTLQVAEDVRQRCADNAFITYQFDGYEDQPIVNEKLILNTEIILT